MLMALLFMYIVYVGSTLSKLAFLGVLICGQNGVGKSSLAREVCYRLKNDTRQWQITLVNLR